MEEDEAPHDPPDETAHEPPDVEVRRLMFSIVDSLRGEYYTSDFHPEAIDPPTAEEALVLRNSSRTLRDCVLFPNGVFPLSYAVPCIDQTANTHHGLRMIAIRACKMIGWGHFLEATRVCVVYDHTLHQTTSDDVVFGGGRFYVLANRWNAHIAGNEEIIAREKSNLLQIRRELHNAWMYGDCAEFCAHAQAPTLRFIVGFVFIFMGILKHEITKVPRDFGFRGYDDPARRHVDEDEEARVQRALPALERGMRELFPLASDEQYIATQQYCAQMMGI